MTLEKENPECPIAFPVTTGMVHSQGMTLRDYFAAKAMQGIMVGDLPASHHGDTVAKWAYSIADAMLKARQL